MNKMFDLDLGLVQGMVNGVRGLCNGLGPALFGFIFYLFNVNLNYSTTSSARLVQSNRTTVNANEHLIYSSSMFTRDIPGPPFLFGAFLATISLIFSLLLPSSHKTINEPRLAAHEPRSSDTDEIHVEFADNLQND
jgi:hypothetical protein